MPLLEELKYMPTEKYARARELLAHSEMIGKRYGLYEKTLFQTEVHAMKWDDHSALWSVETSRNDRIKARFIIPAAGPLHRPKLPGVKGIEDFQGHSFHSSRWDYDYTGGTVNSHELTGLKDKRVAIIGTGATAVQIVPNVANYARELYVFQRTPSSIDIRGNRPTDPAWADALKDGWQKERMDNFNLIVNGAVLSEDHVKDGWTDILQKLLARGNATDQSDPEKAAAERQMADFEKMEQIRARCDDVIQDKSVAESLKPWSVRSTHFLVITPYANFRSGTTSSANAPAFTTSISTHSTSPTSTSSTPKASGSPTSPQPPSSPTTPTIRSTASSTAPASSSPPNGRTAATSKSSAATTAPSPTSGPTAPAPYTAGPPATCPTASGSPSCKPP